MEKDKGDKMYLKKTELEQALRENMQSTLESYGGDSIAEDVIRGIVLKMVSSRKNREESQE